MARIALCLVALAALPARADANPWFPLRPGTTYVYKGTDQGEPVRNVVTVTHRTRVVDGVRCRVVIDRVSTGGRLSERTRDYYAEDRSGNVFYYGEDTAEIDEHGRVVTREGTWHAGVGGARRGLFMPRYPRVGERHFQEFYRGHAEDRFRVTSRTANVVRTREWSRLEPGVVDVKRYRRGVGLVYAATVRGPRERLRLVSVSH